MQKVLLKRVLVLLAVCLGACGSQGEPAEPASPAESADQVETDPASQQPPSEDEAPSAVVLAPVNLTLTNTTGSEVGAVVNLAVGTTVTHKVVWTPANSETVLAPFAMVPVGAVYKLDVQWSKRAFGWGSTQGPTGVDCLADRDRPRFDHNHCSAIVRQESAASKVSSDSER